MWLSNLFAWSCHWRTGSITQPNIKLYWSDIQSGVTHTAVATVSLVRDHVDLRENSTEADNWSRDVKLSSRKQHRKLCNFASASSIMAVSDVFPCPYLILFIGIWAKTPSLGVSGGSCTIFGGHEDAMMLVRRVLLRNFMCRQTHTLVTERRSCIHRWWDIRKISSFDA